MCPRTRNFHLESVCMGLRARYGKKSAMVAAMTASASSFITDARARELLRFHFWFGSLRCSFFIKRVREREVMRKGDREGGGQIERGQRASTQTCSHPHLAVCTGRRSLCSILIAFFSMLLRLFRRLASTSNSRRSFGRPLVRKIPWTVSVNWSGHLTTFRCVKKHIFRVIAYKLIAERQFEATRQWKKNERWKSRNEYQWEMARM